MDNFRDKKIGVLKGTSFDQWIKTNLVGGGYASQRNIFTFSTTADEMRALDRGDVDLVFMDLDLYEDLYQASGKYQVFFKIPAVENFAYGLRKNSDLTPVINQHLTDMIKDGTAQTIANRFFQMNFNEAKVDPSRSSIIPTPTPQVPVYVIPTDSGASCKNGMTFTADITITDGHQVSKGERFRKTWRVKNTGTCTWTTSYSFVFVSGDQMSGQNINVPTSVAPGQTVDLSVDLIAPSSNGTYKGYWQMRSPQGQNFGETIWVKVRVNGGGSSNAPVIYNFYPNFYSGDPFECPTVYWQTGNASTIEIKVDGNSLVKSYSANGSQQICGPLQNYGNHTISLTAMNSSDSAYSSFGYTTQDSGQKRIVPAINYFYVSPDSGVMGDSTTVYWSVSNTAGLDIKVDSTPIYNGNDMTGSAPVSATIQSPGTHYITLTAHSVTDDTSQTVSYYMEEGQRRVIPSIDYFTVDSDYVCPGDSILVYWSVSNAAGIEIYLDMQRIYNGSDMSNSINLQNYFSGNGTHYVGIVAHSVTDDASDQVSFNVGEEFCGGYAGANYYDNEDNFDGGWAGSNYYENEDGFDGGWAGSNYSGG